MEEDSFIAVIVAIGFLYVSGLVIHSFVIGVNVTDWLKRRPLTTAEHIITFLFIAKLHFQLFGLVDTIWSIFWEEISVTYMITSNLADWTLHASVWLSALLSVVYCLKICHFHNPVITHVKRIISSGIFPLITACVLISAGYSSTCLLINLFTSPNKSYENETFENTVDNWEYHLDLFFYVVIITISFVSSTLIIITLCHHVYQMRSNQNLSKHLVAYFKTIKFTIVSFLSCLLCIVIGITVKSWINTIGFEWVYLLWNVFWNLQSICLIWVTTRLRNRFPQIFLTGANCFLNRISSKPNNGVQIETMSP
ncbi:taste receptor type 2 member 50-like [Phyllobates terribilis]|uniref:taste receptor type 2 member 50-like n=1 Tax=Phyllobates terribilis TaxID=111132 RepID=UPI003CCA90C8